MIKPISPKEAIKKKVFPDEVIAAFNKMILENLKKDRSVVKVDEVVNEIVSTSNFKRNELFDKGYLDIEALYRKEGWSVEYNSPDRDENFDSYFVFESK